MPGPEDVRATKALRSELGKRMIDITATDLRVTHGVAYVRGVIRPIKGGPTDLKAELHIVEKIIRQKVGIKELVIDCTIRSG